MSLKKIYKWHRISSLIIAIPVILWALSGFMHPIMTIFRPKVAVQFLQTTPIDSAKIKVPLQIALIENKIDTISNFRIVKIHDNFFYQVQLPNENELTYLNTETGKQLKNGDRLYARYLAKYFLLGKVEPTKPTTEPIAEKTENQTALTSTAGHDCCEAVTEQIEDDNSGVKVKNTELITNFTSEYKFINRLLPAYKIDFDRSDNITVYVETAQSRFAFATDNTRRFTDKVFSLFHTWSWLSFLGKGRFIVEVLLCLLAVATTLMGIYIFFKTKTKNKTENVMVKARNNHRYTSLVFSLFTIMFAGSGALHAFEKLTDDDRDKFYIQNKFAATDIKMDFVKLKSLISNKQISNISLVKFYDNVYWQVATKNANEKFMPKEENKKPKGDLMKNKSVPPPQVEYIDTAYKILPNGERLYASHIASLFSGNQQKDTTSIELITKFEGEYGFVNKRLPVWKVNYPFDSKKRWYVETGSGKLAAKVNDKDLIEGFSFAYLHKHHFMDFAGKLARDFSTMFFAMAQIVLVVIGLILWRKQQKNKAQIV